MIPNLSYIEKVNKITIAKDSPGLYLLQGFLFYTKTPLSNQQKISLTDFSLLLATVIWGSDYPFAKIAMQEISPLSFSAARTLLATAALFPFFLMKESSWKVSRRDFFYLILLACLGTFLNRICWSLGLSLSTASNAALLMTTSPIFVLITSVLLFLAFFRRLRFLVLAFVPVTLGVAVAVGV
ncbi:MAG: EamA family transporter, partial [Deltaproteobacteria bacterium]